LADRKRRDEEEVRSGVCRYCKEEGHILRECRKLKDRKQDVRDRRSSLGLPAEKGDYVSALQRPVAQIDLDDFMTDRESFRPTTPDMPPPSFARPTTPDMPPPPPQDNVFVPISADEDW
jgi:hypothetical protein